jgi:hypothetical protein
MTSENKTKPQRALTSEEEVFLKLFAAELNISNLFQQMEIVSRTVQKLDAAYYEAFPDRLDKDERFDDQLQALKAPPNSGTPRKH